MRSAFPGIGAMPASCRATSPMISPPASVTPTRTFPRPKCFFVTSRERTAHEHIDSKTIDGETESDDSGQYPVHRLPGLHGRLQVVERPARGQARLGIRTPALHALRAAGLRLGVSDHSDVQNRTRPCGVR